MSAFGTRVKRAAPRLVLAALACSYLSSCASTADTPFAFDLSTLQQSEDDRSGISSDMAFVFDETEAGATNAQPPASTDIATEPLTTAEASPAEQAPAAQAEDMAQAPATQDDAAASTGGFLSAFFSSSSATNEASAQAERIAQPAQDEQPAAAPAPVEAAETSAESAEVPQSLARTTSSAPSPIITASTGPLIDTRAGNALVPMDALPGVRADSLFEIRRRSGMDDDDDIDLYEDQGGYQVASAAGLARLAPNGLMKQHGKVETACLKPALVRKLKSIENHFGKRAIITSGYRSPEHNRRVRGARNSYHMACAAADIVVPGVSKQAVAQFARALPGRGGVGTYCHTDSVHVDVGPERDWNWRCRQRR